MHQNNSLNKKRVLIVFHSQSGRTAQLANAVLNGVKQEDVAIRFKMAGAANVDDLLWCDALLIGTPENFGFMSGMIKDFFDRTYYPLQPKAINIPYAIFVSAGNDGTGAVRQIQRIVKGYPMREIAEAIIIKGDPTDEALQACKELGHSMAAGVSMGIF